MLGIGGGERCSAAEGAAPQGPAQGPTGRPAEGGATAGDELQGQGTADGKDRRAQPAH